MILLFAKNCVTIQQAERTRLFHENLARTVVGGPAEQQNSQLHYSSKLSLAGSPGSLA